MIARAKTSRYLHPHPRFNKLLVELLVLISGWICLEDYTLHDIENMRNMLLEFLWKLPDWFGEDGFRKTYSSS